MSFPITNNEYESSYYESQDGDSNISALFNNNINRYFHTEEHSSLKGPFERISKERLIGILENIAKDEEGKNLLTTLKTVMGDQPNRKITFVTSKNLNDIHDCYAFKCESTIASSEEIFISIEREAPSSKERYVFDGEKICKLIIEKDPEAYFTSHELTHAVSFLNAGNISSPKEWENRKNNWDEFLQNDRMKPINNRLKGQGLSQEKINEIFKFFLQLQKKREIY